jgi:hypothetical protein
MIEAWGGEIIDIPREGIAAASVSDNTSSRAIEVILLPIHTRNLRAWSLMSLT